MRRCIWEVRSGEGEVSNKVTGVGGDVISRVGRWKCVRVIPGLVWVRTLENYKRE